MGVPVLEMKESTYDSIEEAIHETFSSILSLNLKITNIEVGQIQNPPRNISGFIILRNPKIQGTLSIAFPNQTALQIFSNFYGSKIDQIDERVLEGVGELTNMVYGCLKRRLNDEGFNLQMFIPVIVVGSEFNHLKDPASNSSVTIHFQSSEGNFWVELAMKAKPRMKRAKPKIKTTSKNHSRKKAS